MGFAFIGPEQEARIAEIIAFASKPERIWDLIGGHEIEHEAHSVILGTYLAQFTLTRNVDGVLFRHVSVACLPRSITPRSPNRIIVVEIGKAFGMRDPYKFDGWAMATCGCGCGALQALQRFDPPPPGWVSP